MFEHRGACPSVELLEALAAEQEVAPETRAHVAGCAECREALRRIREDNAYLASFRIGGSWPGHAPAEPPAPIAIPGYDIVRELHRGGQGVVFQALQRSTKRAVAIKVMREGVFATLSERSRFMREIEALGRLDHPHIVAVHDAGVVRGLHYFVMDYVDGLPLDGAAAAFTAGPAEGERTTARGARVTALLRLFVKICDAVHSAHLRGIIHRDLKPSNIRVDQAGQPHVLDFGLAKAVDDGAPDMTMTGQFVGSLPWASPEQVAGTPSRIDLRTDVYSLGAILYQLLTDRTPFDVGGNLHEATERILHHDPPRPGALAASRGLRLDDDLETIVLKCLAKERERRYQSVDELARDLRHYLAGEALDAKRDSAWYVLRKTAWRKRRVFIAVAVPMALFPFALFASYRSTLATRQAELERDLRQVEAVRNTAMLEISRRLQARPDSEADSPGGRLSIRNIQGLQNDLDTGSLSVSDQGVALLLAETLRDRGMIVQAEDLVRRALYMLQCTHGPQHPEVGRMRATLADLLVRRATRMAEAEQTAERAVRELQAAFGETGAELARGWTVLARVRLARGDVDGALDAVQRALAADDQPSSHAHVSAQAVRAQVHAARGEVDAARRDCLGALQSRLVLVHDTDIRLLDSLQIAADLLERGVLAEDDVLDSSALRGALSGLPPHTALREAVAVLRGGTDGTARDASVLPSRLVLVGLRERLLGTGHPSLGASLAVTAGLLSQEAYQGEVLNETCLLEAVALFRRAIPLQIAANGADSPLVGKSYEKLATCMVALGRLREGTQWFARDCELWMRQPPELRDEFQILIRARWTAWHATRAGEYELGLAWAERTLDVLAHTLGPDDGGAALVHACRALCFAQLERQSEAEANDARAVDILARQTVPDDQRIECDRLLALTRLRLGRIQDARELLEPAWVAVQPMFERGSKVLRCEWSQAMLQYCRALGDNGRAQEFANRLRDEGTGDLRPGITERVFGSELEPWAAP